MKKATVNQKLMISNLRELTPDSFEAFRVVNNTLGHAWSVVDPQDRRPFINALLALAYDLKDANEESEKS